MQGYSQSLVLDERPGESSRKLTDSIACTRDSLNVHGVRDVPAPLGIATLEAVHARGGPLARLEEAVEIVYRPAADQRHGAPE